MIGLDTNVLVRYIVQDDPKQEAQAADVIESAVKDGTALYVDDIVFCELVWVLESAYHFKRPEIGSVLHRLSQSEGIVVEDSELIHSAISLYTQGTADFSDYLILVRCLSRGCDTLVTFDKKLGRHSNEIQLLL